MKKLAAILIIFTVCLSLCACTPNVIPPEPITTQDSQATLPNPPEVTTPTSSWIPITEPPVDVTEDRSIMTELYGSYLTMKIAQPADESIDGQYIEVFRSFEEIEEYFAKTDPYFLYGKKLITALVSFDDTYLASNDVMLIKINEPSSYISHQNVRLRIEDGILNVGFERHIPYNAPGGDTQYHLILTAPKGSFNGLDDMEVKFNPTEVMDNSKDSANDAERYLYLYPEYVPFSYRTDAVDTPSMVIDVINSYDKLVAFHEKHKNSFDLTEFKKHIGSLYDEAVFNDYTLLAMMLPSSGDVPPEITELFVYNLEIYITVDRAMPEVIDSTTPCYLLMTAVSNSDLRWIDLSMFNISFE